MELDLLDLNKADLETSIFDFMGINDLDLSLIDKVEFADSRKIMKYLQKMTSFI